MIGYKQKKVLSVYSEHIGNQEAEISQLNSLLNDYRTKHGTIELSDSLEVRKANLEQDLQDLRSENQSLSLQVQSQEEEYQNLRKQVAQMEEALHTLTSEKTGKELANLQQQVQDLEGQSQQLEGEVRQLENQLQESMASRA